ncbi:MAG: c-type cytochrome [Euryarchaeota archaeon]|nr:c-type cytochrome [Euryarchaeota archaeon]
MRALTIAAGVAALVLVALAVTVLLPMGDPSLYQPSPGVKPLSELEERGRQVYIREGCWYCHTQQVRNLSMDVQYYGRVSVPGEYAYDSPVLLGTERTGPDLARIGGVYTDDWHLAHFINPRYVVPASIMPSFSYLSDEELEALIAYVQSLGGEEARRKAEMQRRMKQAMLEAQRLGREEEMMRAMVPASYRELRNPLAESEEAVLLGRRLFAFHCSGCHGSTGAGDGPAAEYLSPKPANFTSAEFMDSVEDGRLYYSILNGVPGTGMHPFRAKLTEREVWSLVAYLRTLQEG